MSDITSIYITKQALKKMHKEKRYKRETHDEQINRLLKCAVAVLCFIFLINLSSALTYVDSCMDLDIAGETYVQNDSIQNSTSTNCININKANITFDGNSFIINNTHGGTFAQSVITASASNITLKNLNIKQFKSTQGVIRISGLDITLRDTIIEGLNSATEYSVVISNKRAIINNLTTNGVTNPINLDGGNAKDLVLTNSYFKDGNFAFSATSSTNTNATITNLSVINFSYSTSEVMENLYGGSIWTNLYVYSNNSGGSIFSASGSLNYGKNVTFINFKLEGQYAELFSTIVTGMKNVTFINASYDINKENIGANSELIRKWYFNAQVNDTRNLSVSGATVKAYNNSGALQFSALTGTNGKIPTQELIEYVNNGGTRSYYSNYTINASKIGWTTNSISINITGNTESFFFLSKILCPPKKLHWGAHRTNITDSTIPCH